MTKASLQVAPAMPSGSLTRPVLQRKCACGGSESECEECREKGSFIAHRLPAGGVWTPQFDTIKPEPQGKLWKMRFMQKSLLPAR
jgi:hypothetical protein